MKARMRPAGCQDDPAPTIVSITPSVGSIGGGSWITIVGTGFLHGVRVTLGGMTVNASIDPRSPDRLSLQTPAHAAGVVDVVVTNPDRQTARSEVAYTFKSPGFFDVDGEWGGFAFTDDHDWLTFTVAASSVVSISSGDSGVVVLSACASP